MDNTATDYTHLAEFILPGNSENDTKTISKLVRILKRSSTLPKVDDIYINVVEEPYRFHIQPGVSISIGFEYLSNPLVALLCLRYGLEWQIWHKCQPKNSYDVRICDLAAFRALYKFLMLTPIVDRDSINILPTELSENLKKIENDDDLESILKKINFEALGIFHQQKVKKGKLNKESLEAVKQLAYPVEYMLMSGGDFRLNIDPETLLNKYGCRPFPRPEAFTFASSTASSISNTAYNKAQHKRISLIKEGLKEGIENIERKFAKEIRRGIRSALHLTSDTKIVLGPSGTDISLYISGICQALYNKEITHILVAADETGSGVPLALQGCHFSNSTSQGKKVNKGELLDGFRKTDLKKINLRNESGHLKSTATVDEEVYEAIYQTLKDGKQAVLHIIDQSKLGYYAPSEKCLTRLNKEFGDSLPMVVDNSQFRMDPEDIKSYLTKGYLMIITGSKFFTGPPFSGALLIPEKIVKRWGEVKGLLPKGLYDYTYQNDWFVFPFTEKLAEGINIGLEMRWFASLEEIKRYYKTPLSLRVLGIEMFCNLVDKSIRESKFLEHIRGFNQISKQKVDLVKMRNRKTIFPFFVKFEDRVLNKSELDMLYLLLNRNLSKEFENETDEIKRLAGQPCHIGQPVACVYTDGSPSGVLRINLGSRVISESWKELDSSMFFKSIEDQMIQIDIIIRKIELLLKYPELLKNKTELSQ